METYGATKTRVFHQMTSDGFAAIPSDPRTNPRGLLSHGETDATALWLDRHPGVTQAGDSLLLQGTIDDGKVDLSRLTLLGEHNRQNAAAAVLLCVCAGVPRDALDLAVLSALLIAALIWLILQAAGTIANALGQTGMNVATRFMGLILAAMAIEFITTGLSAIFPGWVSA